VHEYRFWNQLAAGEVSLFSCKHLFRSWGIYLRTLSQRDPFQRACLRPCGRLKYLRDATHMYTPERTTIDRPVPLALPASIPHLSSRYFLIGRILDRSTRARLPAIRFFGMAESMTNLPSRGVHWTKAFRVTASFPRPQRTLDDRWRARDVYGGAQACFHMWLAKKAPPEAVMRSWVDVPVDLWGIHDEISFLQLTLEIRSLFPRGKGENFVSLPLEGRPAFPRIVNIIILESNG